MFDKNNLVEKNKKEIIKRAIETDVDNSFVLTGLNFKRDVNTNADIDVQDLCKKYNKGEIDDEDLFVMHFKKEILSSKDYSRIKMYSYFTQEEINELVQ